MCWSIRLTGVSLALVLTHLAAPQIVTANAWSILGYDGDSIAKGGALTGGASGPAAVYYNVAGLAKSTRSHGVMSYIHSRSLLNIDVDDNPDLIDFSRFQRFSDAEIENTCATSDNGDTCVRDLRRYNEYLERAPGVLAAYQNVNAQQLHDARNPRKLHGLTLGFSAPLTTGDSGAALAIGGSVFLPSRTLVYQRIKGPTSPYFLPYDDGPHRIVVDLGGAIEIIPGLRAGAGVDILADINGQFDANILLPAELRLGSVLQPDPNLADIGMVLDGRLEVPLTLAWLAGIQYSPNETWDFGFSFRDEQQVDVSFDADLAIATPFGTQNIPVQVASQARFRPRELALGMAWHSDFGLHVFTDLTWRQWSRFRPEIAISAEIPDTAISDALCETLRTFSDLNDLTDLVDLGADDICPLIEQQLDDQELGFSTYNPQTNKAKNTFSPALGLSYASDRWETSAGYRFEPNPLPVQDGIFNILDAHTHVYSLGANVRFFEVVTFGIFTQYRQLKKAYSQKSRAKLENQSNNSDAFPDLDDQPANGPPSGFSTDHPRLNDLRDAIDDVQILNPTWPGFTLSGGYLSMGVQLSLVF